MKEIAFFTRYDKLGASSRLRFMQFIPFLEAAGVKVRLSSFFDDDYLQALYQGKKRSKSGVLKAYYHRFKAMRDLPSTIPVVIEYELLPYLPFIFEKNFLAKHPYILNFDDAVDLRYSRLPVLKNKYPQLLSRAAGIITANDLLTEKFSPYNSNILKLATIPPEHIHPGRNKENLLTLVWTGTPVTAQFLHARKNALQMAAEKTAFRLLIVGGTPGMEIPGVECEIIPWSEASEADALSRAHAGIMPLPDTPFARGKSAYKLICYLRAGIPGIASPVGENCRVIRHNENGFLVNSDEEWSEAVSKISRPDIYRKMSQAALADAGNYLPAAAAEKLLDFLRNTLS
ncbi:MAG: glycosyltransferase [Lentisphaeria bacterium]|nr:glycosyltransferase [Lentisphaeria bacterium]